MIALPVMAGVGNAVMTVPLARELGRRDELVVEAGNAAIADVFARLPEVGRVVVLPKGVAGLRAHRRVAADTLVIPFPSNRWQYSLLAAASRARRVVMHDYPCGSTRTGRCLLQKVTLVPAARGLHDVDQNLKLLTALNPATGSCDSTSRSRVEPTFPLDAQERSFAKGVREAHGAVLIQPGCANTIVGAAKRLPPETWAAVAGGLDHKVALIEGPDEPGVAGAVAALCERTPPVVRLHGTLGQAAAVLERAACFAGVDSGLAHIAAAVGRPAVAVFCAADPERVCPHGYRHLVVTPPGDWRPRLLYPMEHPRPKLRPSAIDWPGRVRATDVLAKIALALSPGGRPRYGAGDPPR